MIAEEDMVIAITRSGYIKRLPVTAYSEQRRGGIGVMGMDLKDEDYIEHLFVASTHDYILFFTSVGKVYRLKVHELPLGSRQAKGRAIVNLLPVPPGRAGARGDPDAQLRRGRVPALRDQERRRQEDEARASTTRRSRPTGSSRSRCARATSSSPCATARPGDDILLVSRKGQAIRFGEAGRPRDGPRDRGRARDDAPRRRRGDRRGDRPRRLRPARRDRERLRQAHARLRVSAQGPRRHGRADGQADRGARLPRRRARRPRRLPGDADLDRRHR